LSEYKEEVPGVMSAVTDRPVVVGIDGSAASLASIRTAATEAALRRRPLRLVHVDSWTAHPGWVDVDPIGSLATEISTDPEQIVKEAVELAAGFARTPVTAEVVPGEPGAVLVRESRTAELLVICHRGAGGFLGLRLGSVAVRVAAHARCPVLVTRGTPVRDGCVLVGIDGSSANRRAVGFAFDEAAQRGARLLALHSSPGPEADADRLPALGELAGRYPQVHLERSVVRARPAGALVAASELAQLVVVGTHGHGGRPTLPFGSVTHALLHHAACPVVAVPSKR
jgi:nucleotide-binding universal stress UspA family protein